MNSPGGSARTPIRFDRDRSISPQPLDPATETGSTISSNSDLPGERYVQPTSRHRAASLFCVLPSKIISRILWAADANTFATLCILNRTWYHEAQNVELYAYHLSRCPSYALSNSIISGPFRRNDLLRLKTKFAAEVRRNLFDVYIRPRRTFINLISMTTNSSAAFPTGEAFRFEFSANATTVLALSSSRIYVIDVTRDPPVVTRQLKTLRRPLSASVTDDGSLLAVLSSKHQVNIYGLTDHGVQHLQVIALDNPPKIIAIAHEGTVLAASYDAGVEVFSLAANSLTTDRRAVRSEAVDTLSFSSDGSMLVGSSLGLEDPNAVVISAPFYTENDPDLPQREIHSRMWTTQILFPQISSVCSHVTLLSGHSEADATWLFAFDHSLMSYRAVRTDDTRAGVAYFLSPPGADRFDVPNPTLAPSATTCGTLAVAGFEGSGLCLYGVPERLDLSPDMGAVIERQNDRQVRGIGRLTSATGNTEPLMAYSPSNSASDYSIEDDSLASKVDWRQSLFVKYKSIKGLYGQTAARWVEHYESSSTQVKKRLVVVAPGGVSLAGDELGDESMPVDGSRMCLLDFDYRPSTNSDRTLTIEVGEVETQLLTEHTGSLANEVALERRRTIRALPTLEGPRMSLGRSVTSISPPSMPFFEDGFGKGSVSSPSSPTEQSRGSQVYSPGSLQRSVTASGFRFARYPPRPPLGSAQYLDRHGNQRMNQYGRPISEDSWETPPPPYAGGSPPISPQQSARAGGSAVSPQIHPLTLSPIERPRTQPSHTQFRPYHTLVAERANAGGLQDPSMTSHALPTGVSITQYEEMVIASRVRSPGGLSISSGDESLGDIPRPLRIGVGHSRAFGSNFNTDGHGPGQPRPLTHHGPMPYAHRSFSLPVVPQDLNVPNGVDSKGEPQSRLSLTGANLQNRLNHPVPPIPEIHPAFRSTAQVVEPEFGPDNRGPPQQHEEHNMYPSMPTADQIANFNHRLSQSDMQRPMPVKNTNFIHRVPVPVSLPVSVPVAMPVHNVAPSPPRAAWGATGVPGVPTINQARNIPNGYARPRGDSRESSVSHLASASAPNLLLQRPRYGRLDTIDSMNDVIGEASGEQRSRAQSLTQAIVAPNAEPSAYHETSRSGPSLTKYGKKSRKKKEENTKKVSKCTVM